MKCCRSKPTTEEKDLPKKSPPKLPNPNRFVRPKFVVRKGKGMANVPFWKTMFFIMERENYIFRDLSLP